MVQHSISKFPIFHHSPLIDNAKELILCIMNQFSLELGFLATCLKNAQRIMLPVPKNNLYLKNRLNLIPKNRGPTYSC